MVKYGNPTAWGSEDCKDLINFGVISYTTAMYK